MPIISYFITPLRHCHIFAFEPPLFHSFSLITPLFSAADIACFRPISTPFRFLQLPRQRHYRLLPRGFMFA